VRERLSRREPPPAAAELRQVDRCARGAAPSRVAAAALRRLFSFVLPGRCYFSADAAARAMSFRAASHRVRRRAAPMDKRDEAPLFLHAAAAYAAAPKIYRCKNMSVS